MDAGQPKPKVTVIRPRTCSVANIPTGEVVIEFELSDTEAVSIMLPAEGKEALVKALTGGIILGGELPPGFNNGD